MVLAYYS